MITTPYHVYDPHTTHHGVVSFSRQRTSKIMYINELLDSSALILSRKISQVTRYKLKTDKFASENFQVMNYGIGGRISYHLDETLEGLPEKLAYGGGKFGLK